MPLSVFRSLKTSHPSFRPSEALTPLQALSLVPMIDPVPVRRKKVTPVLRRRNRNRVRRREGVAAGAGRVERRDPAQRLELVTPALGQKKRTEITKRRRRRKKRKTKTKKIRKTKGKRVEIPKKMMIR